MFRTPSGCRGLSLSAAMVALVMALPASAGEVSSASFVGSTVDVRYELPFATVFPNVNEFEYTGTNLLTFSLSPRFAINDTLSLSAGYSVTRRLGFAAREQQIAIDGGLTGDAELTLSSGNAPDRLNSKEVCIDGDQNAFGGEAQCFNVDRNELWVSSDLRLTLHANRFVTIPGVDVPVSASFGVALPTSQASRVAGAMLLGLNASLGLSKTVSVLEGLTFGYGLRGSVPIRNATTSQYVGARGTCSSPSECAEFSQSGTRLSAFTLQNIFSLGLGLTEQLSVSGYFGVVNTKLYGLADANVSESGGVDTGGGGGEPCSEDVDQSLTGNTDPAGSPCMEVKNSDWRNATISGVTIGYTPWSPLTLTLGVETSAPQLDPSDTRSYTLPFDKNYTSFVLGLSFDVGGLVHTLSTDEEEIIEDIDEVDDVIEAPVEPQATAPATTIQIEAPPADTAVDDAEAAVEDAEDEVLDESESALQRSEDTMQDSVQDSVVAPIQDQSGQPLDAGQE